MKQEINLSQFRQAFKDMGRGEQFSYEGLAALFAYLEDEVEGYTLDVIALCCEFTEATLEEVQASYPDITSLEKLAEKTIVLSVDGERVIYQAY